MQQLKEKIHLYNSYIKYYISQNSFKGLYLLSLIVAFYGGSSRRIRGDFLDGFISSYSFPTFVILFFVLNIVNAIMFNRFFDGVSHFHDIRVGNKKHILKEKIIMSLMLCFYFNILFFMVNLSLIFMHKGGIIFNDLYLNYNISRLTYFIYSFIRLFLFTCIVVIYNVILYEKFNFKVVIADFLFLLGFWLVGYKGVNTFTLNIYYIIMFVKFVSFKNDLLCSVISLVLLFGFSFILLNARKLQNNILPVIISDTKYLINKKLNIVIIYLLVHFLLFYFFRNIKTDYEFMFGLNVDFNNFYIIYFLSFVFNEVTYIFILVKLFEKDLEYMYSVIFSRLRISNWFISKILSFLFIILFLKLVDYSVFYLFFRLDLFIVIKYLVSDILNILIIQMFITIISLLKKNKYLYIISFILMVILLPKNILSLYDYKFIILFMFIVVNGAFIFISKLKNNTIFNLIGGSYDRNKKYC